MSFEFFTIKYQKFSIKIILIEVNHKFYIFNTFFALQILFRHIYIFCIWTINSERFSRYLYRVKKVKIKEIDKSQHNFYLFTYVILVHLLIKDIFTFTSSNTLRIIHNSLFLFSKFTYKVGYIKMAGKPQKLPFQWFFFYTICYPYS